MELAHNRPVVGLVHQEQVEVVPRLKYAETLYEPVVEEEVQSICQWAHQVLPERLNHSVAIGLWGNEVSDCLRNLPPVERPHYHWLVGPVT